MSTTEYQGYAIAHGMLPHAGRPAKGSSMRTLIALAKHMRCGQAVLLSYSDMNTFRTILAAQGYSCVSDAYQSSVTGKTWVFKLKNNYENFAQAP